MKIKTKTRTICAIFVAYVVLFVGFGLAYSVIKLIVK